jgi:Rrf2 family protein
VHGLTTKGRYATRVLVYLARRRQEGPIKKQDIADAEGISPDYVEQILIRLKAAGFVKSHRGKAGGFSLAGDPGSLTVAGVLDVMEGRMSMVPCLGEGESCARSATCCTRALWSRADQALKQVFTNATIGELAQGSLKEAEFTI